MPRMSKSVIKQEIKGSQSLAKDAQENAEKLLKEAKAARAAGDNLTADICESYAADFAKKALKYLDDVRELSKLL